MSKKNGAISESLSAGAIVLTRPVRIPYGWAVAAVSHGRLLGVAWEDGLEALGRVVAARYPAAVTVDPRDEPAGRYLLSYAAGDPVGGVADAGLAIAWERVGAFDRDILRETATIPYGRTIAYGELAARAGRPGASRAAGAALSRNPWPIIVPCHRVVGANGALVGFGKGLEAKEALLRFEAEAAARPTGGGAQ